jgi:hypothetical protein
MRRNNRAILKLEHLEGRDMPSTGLPGTDPIILSAHDPALARWDGPVAEIHLRRIVTDAVTGSGIKLQHLGQGSGTYTNGFEFDAGVPYHLTGSGQFVGLIGAKIAGSLYSVGFIRTGHAVGELTFSNAKGSVTIELVGPEQPGFSPLPSKFSYTVEKGTGAYARLTGSGSLTLELSPITFLTGTFTLTIDSYHKR